MKHGIIEPEQATSKTAVQVLLLVIGATVYYFGFDRLVSWLESFQRQELASLLSAQVSVKILLGMLLLAVTLAIFNIQTLRLRLRHYRATLDFLKEEFDQLAENVQSLSRANQSLKHHLYMRPKSQATVPPGEYPAAYGVKIDLPKDKNE